jgi:hypothetical protein
MAEHDREPWSSDEAEFLIVFFGEAKGQPDAEREVAEALGRTIEACRQRYYELLRGQGRVVHRKETHTVETTTTYIGAFDDPEEQWWSPGHHDDK